MILTSEYVTLSSHEVTRDGLLHVSGQIYPDHDSELTRSLYLMLVGNKVPCDVVNTSSEPGEHVPARLGCVVRVRRGDVIEFQGRVLAYSGKPGWLRRMFGRKQVVNAPARIIGTVPYQHFSYEYGD